MKTIEIIFENDDCLAVNKPAGLAVQGGAGLGRSLDRILAEMRRPAPLLVHRLDRDTSGVILAAKSRDAAARLSAAWRHAPGAVSGGVRKRYRAVCAGNPGPESGIIRVDLAVRGRILKAETRWRRLGGGSLPEPPGAGTPGTAAPGGATAYSVLELEPGTGRMHQIRRHLREIGCPILGDGKYGDFPLNRRLAKSAGLRRLLLHAARLEIAPGVLGYPLDLAAPLPDAFDPWTL